VIVPALIVAAVWYVMMKSAPRKLPSVASAHQVPPRGKDSCTTNETAGIDRITSAIYAGRCLNVSPATRRGSIIQGMRLLHEAQQESLSSSDPFSSLDSNSIDDEEGLSTDDDTHADGVSVIIQNAADVQSIATNDICNEPVLIDCGYRQAHYSELSIDASVEAIITEEDRYRNKQRNCSLAIPGDSIIQGMRLLHEAQKKSLNSSDSFSIVDSSSIDDEGLSTDDDCEDNIGADYWVVDVNHPFSLSATGDKLQFDEEEGGSNDSSSSLKSSSIDDEGLSTDDDCEDNVGADYWVVDVNHPFSLSATGDKLQFGEEEGGTNDSSLSDDSEIISQQVEKEEEAGSINTFSDDSE
jgi:hypothetical protein